MILRVLINLNGLLFMWLICYSEWSSGAMEKRRCRLRGSCRYSSGWDPFLLDGKEFQKKNCFCDPQCRKYEDCCFDAPIKNSSNTAKEFTCIDMGKTFGSYFMKKSCPSNTTNVEMEQLCLNSSSVLSLFPVTSTESLETYANVYCAACNDETTHSVKLWNPVVNCHSAREIRLFDYNWRYNTSSKNFTITYNNGELQCQLYTLVPPLEVKPLSLRKCKSHISTCPSTWVDVFTMEKCKEYTDYRYFNNNVYRNKFCALCNDVPIGKIQCVENEMEKWSNFMFESYEWTNGIKISCDTLNDNQFVHNNNDYVSDPLKIAGRIIYYPEEEMQSEKNIECFLKGKCLNSESKICEQCPMFRMDPFPIAPETIKVNDTCVHTVKILITTQYHREGRMSNY